MKIYNKYQLEEQGYWLVLEDDGWGSIRTSGFFSKWYLKGTIKEVLSYIKKYGAKCSEYKIEKIKIKIL